ncbi:transglutaminase domain-containing protein [Zhouia sp. PK063]|uniref:DUF3857 domain-containing protein n=1 Tax=Zhouia sp. PK063 TaxID=3373602 RepID=UPI00378C2CC4
MKTKLLIILLFACVYTMRAQDYDFGKVSEAELKEAKSDIDSTAGAEILYFHQDSYIEITTASPQLITEVHKRIKFYNNRPEDFEFATQKVNLYKSGGTRENIRKIKGYTYNLVDGKIEKTKLDKDQIFEKEMSNNYDQTSFTLPNLKKGSVIEYSYTVVSPYFINFSPFQYQFSIPVKKAIGDIRTPKEFNYKRIPKGAYGVFPKMETKRDNRIGSDVLHLTYDLNNVPPLKEEPYVDNIDNYRSGIMFELMSISMQGYPTKYYSQTWKDVGNQILSDGNYDEDLDKSSIYKDEIDALIANENDSLAKTKAIFNYVKKNIKWNSYYGKYMDNGIRKTFKEKTGNDADINLLLISMLRYAGIKANPIVISTRDNIKPYFPTLDQMNAVIACADIGKNRYFLDATDEFSDLNILPINDYNWNGLLLDNIDKKGELVAVKQPEQAQMTTVAQINLNEDGSISGKARVKRDHHYAYLFRKKYKDLGQDDYLTEKEKALDGIEISDYEVKNQDVSEGDVHETFSFNQQGAAEKLDNKILVKPLAFYTEEENPFKLEKREFPVDFGYSFKDKYIVTLQIPEGYKVETLPQSAKVVMPKNLGEFIYMATASGNFIRLSVTFDIENATIAPEDYAYLKGFYDQMIKKEAEKIVLTKI